MIPSDVLRVLIVDDQAGLAQTLSLAISRLGSKVRPMIANSARLALEIAGKEGVDILVTDMIMPEMTGLELVEKMRDLPSGRPSHIILMTAYEVPGLKETARRLGIHDTIIKPFHPEELIRRLTIFWGNEPKPAQSSQQETAGSFTILIADDVPDNITLLSRYMENEGYRYITAADGEEALQVTRAEKPDLVLLDVNMPKKDGFSVLKELREDPVIKHIPVIIFTAARLHPHDIQNGLVLGADDYITKPFDRRELFARIRIKLKVKESNDALMRRNRELSILPEIGRQLSARHNIHEIGDLVLQHAVTAFGANNGHFIVPTSSSFIHREYTISQSAASGMSTLPVNNLWEELSENRESILIPDTSLDPKWENVFAGRSHSVVVVPILGRFNILGLITLVHEKKGYFNSDHLVLLNSIVSQAGIAVENAQLHTSLVEEQSRLAAVLENAADSIVLFDANASISMMNSAAQQLFKDIGGVLGLPLIRGNGQGQLLQALEVALETKVPNKLEITWADQRVLMANFTPLPQGGCVLLLHDVSHFKDLERVKNEFIATASHDLRNPLTSIKGYSQLMLQTGGLSDFQTDFIRRIQRGATNMEELISNMLDLAKMDLQAKIQFEVTHLAPILEELWDEFNPQAEAKAQTLTLETMEIKDLDVSSEPSKLRQVFRNLIGNAIKYTPQDGNIKIFATRSGNDHVLIHIKDTGYGIPEADLPNLFKRFYRVRNNGHDEIEGNGLGLAIVKVLVEQHHGTITVKSKKGEGSCFTVSLPLISNPEIESPSHEQDSLEKKTAKKRTPLAEIPNKT